MNTLEKFFNAIRNSPSAELKAYTSRELIRQLPEFEDHLLYILKNVYEFLTSENSQNRLCAAKILNAIDSFEYIKSFKVESTTSDYVYLQYKDIIEDTALSKEKQQMGLKKKLKLEHADSLFLDSLDYSVSQSQSKFKIHEVEEKKIENVYGFFEAISMMLLSPEWYKRHGAFLAHCAMLAPKDMLYADLEMIENINLESDEKAEYNNFNSNKPADNINAEDNVKPNCSCSNLNNNTKNVEGNVKLNCSCKDAADDLNREESLKIKINVEEKLFNIIYEILKNDKFNDFIDNRTSAPVRESAALLLKYIFPSVKDPNLLLLIIELLNSPDWQEQFSGLLALYQLKEDVSRSLNNIQKLCLQALFSLLSSEDEDIKYLSAEILSYFISTAPVEIEVVKEIAGRCWEQINDEVDIAHSKASVIILLKNIYLRYEMRSIESLQMLYPCFTSPVSMIRQSVLELCEIVTNEETLYLLGEAILLSNSAKTRSKSVKILSQKIESMDPSLLSDFGAHFHRLISVNLFSPYKEDDFACYEDTFFTADGIKSLGYNKILSNRACLFRILQKLQEYNIENDTKEFLGIAFNSLKRIQNSSDSFNTKLQLDHKGSNPGSQLDYKGSQLDYKGSNPGSQPQFKGSNSTMGEPQLEDIKSLKSNIREPQNEELSNSKEKSIEELLLERIESDFKKFSCLKKMPIEEFKKIIKNPFYNSAYPMCHEYAQSYIRAMTCENIHLISDFDLYFKTETCEDFIRLVSPFINDSFILKAYNRIIELSHSISSYEKADSTCEIVKKKRGNSRKVAEDIETVDHMSLVSRQALRNYILYFSTNSDRISNSPDYSFILNAPNREIFFSHTIKYFRFNRQTEKIFHESLNSKNTVVLREFIQDLRFNELFVRSIIDSFDVDTLSDLLDYSDPSFNVLFTKLVLKHMSNSHGSSNPSSRAQNLLSRIIISLNFKPNANISPDLLDRIQEEQEDIKMIVNPSDIKEYSISVPISIDLRDYQKEGIKWLGFLHKFGLNGILADDMGLGKTIQVLAYMISEQNLRSTSFNTEITNEDLSGGSNTNSISTAIPIEIGSNHGSFNNTIIPNAKESGSNHNSFNNTIIPNAKEIGSNHNSFNEVKAKYPTIKNIKGGKDNALDIKEETGSLLNNKLNKANKLNKTNSCNEANNCNEASKLNKTNNCNEANSCNGAKCLIICPSSLTGHWKDEIMKYFQKESLIFDNKAKNTDEDIVIATYDSVRKDTGPLTKQEWFIVVIDEGHVLKNRGSALYSKICEIQSERKVILTGTPVMNTVEDIFSLFNIIMPGYLGSESEFLSTYGCKITDKNVSEMEKRLESLHKKILPFVMRRLKKDVLKDLPEKIIKDLIVEMNQEHSELYKQVESGIISKDEEVYKSIVKGNIFSSSFKAKQPGADDRKSLRSDEEHFSSILIEEKLNTDAINLKSQAGNHLENSVEINSLKESFGFRDAIPGVRMKGDLNNSVSDQSNSFGPGKGEHQSIDPGSLNDSIQKQSLNPIQSIDPGSLNDSVNYESLKKQSFGHTRDLLKAASHPAHFDRDFPSSKSLALSEIFSICGERKVLVFFQFKRTIDFVVKELNLSNFLRLDGTIPPAQRSSIVSRFHNESVRYLFLTTSIGGLGLNLTCADTVVFYEHDWNPFNDLQAMDRAHRLGQKNTVNVFRLICKNTIEERVMNYQNFKMYVANSVVTQQNTNITQMDTKNLLERFE